ncbi:MAG: hypothetical protein L0Y35_02915 [Flammeovirgaceae bacterium]|nr:hypothetical protein [Flammeovirgaceae bacterium]
MKKLEDIPKRQVFDVPDGYFDRLPGIIQARITAPKPVTEKYPALGFSLKYALPVMLLSVVSIFMYQNWNREQNAETILATVSTDALVDYLEEIDINTDDLIAESNLTTQEAENIEQDVYMNLDLSEEELLNELDI